MSRSRLVAVAGLAAGLAWFGVATGQPGSTQPKDAKDAKAKQPAAAGQPELPPGMSAEDMQACMAAATPGAEHTKLAENAGTWSGKTKMWMTPDQSEPVVSTCTTTITPIFDGRYVRIETKGEIPEMGIFEGFGINGYDNVTKKYQATWIDNCGTSIATGTGEASADGKTYTWKLSYSCPITKKPTALREVEKRTSKDSFTLEMYGLEPHSQKEFKMMEIAYTRTGAAPTGAAPTGTRPAGSSR